MTKASKQFAPRPDDGAPGRPRARKPPWLRVRVGGGEGFAATCARMRNHRLHTVCEEARCPNLGHCWSHGRATVLILGKHCTRACRFCNVGRRQAPLPPDPGEPQRVALAVAESGLREVVLTSVTRDDLPDGGSSHWAETIACVRSAAPGVLIEVLVPDFKGDAAALARVLAAGPDIFGHNLETVPRLYPGARPEAVYARSLALLRRAARTGAVVKTSLMLGLGEREDEVLATLAEARAAGVEIVYLGQYLQPTPGHLPVAEYVPPESFERLGEAARALGFGFVSSAPLVRSSFHEEGQSRHVRMLAGRGGPR